MYERTRAARYLVCLAHFSIPSRSQQVSAGTTVDCRKHILAARKSDGAAGILKPGYLMVFLSCPAKISPAGKTIVLILSAYIGRVSTFARVVLLIVLTVQ